jgi:hypothetical protein
MALLNEPADGAHLRWHDAPSSPRRNRALALLLAVAAAGCAVFNAMGETEQRSGFRHALHGAEAGLTCVNCHRTAEREAEPGMPRPNQCQICHQKIDADKPPERQAAALFDADDNLRRTPREYLADEVLFSHEKHVAAGTQCATCHEGIEADAPQAAMRMRNCVDCHTEQRAANECATCHREIRADRPPASHAFGWQRTHGKAVRAHGIETGDDCSLCHQESGCAKCHLEVPPANHNNYFRLRGHGLMARMDRQNCAACHRTDSCDACHRESRPINHGGLFGAPRNNHCVSCHLPVTNTDCATCHRGTPSHSTATPLPPGHTPAMNCRQCHGRGAPLQHADNGTECITCHR